MIILLAAFCTAGRAQDISTGPIALENVLGSALAENPELKAARRAWEAASRLPSQAGSFDDPVVNISHMLVDLQTKAGPVKDKFSVTQKVPFLGKRGLRRKAASMEAELSRQAYRAKGLEIAVRVVRSYYELYFLERSVDILSEQQELLDSFSQVAEKKYATGKTPQAMVFRAQVELAKLANDLVTAEQARLSARARLNALLNRQPDAPLGSPAAPPEPASERDAPALRALALEYRPEILALKSLEGRRDAERRLALRSYFPDFMLGYEYTAIGAGTTNLSHDGKAAQAVMVGFNIPLWLGKNRAEVDGSKAAMEASRASLEDIQNQTRYQVEDLSVKADTALRLFKLYDTTVLPRARAALDSMRGAYESDAAGFLDLLDSERALLGFELAQERNRVDFTVETAELARITGQDLRGGIYE